jgi:hypothetical protein
MITSSRDEFIRALGNVLDAYDRERSIPPVESADDTADRALDRAHVAEARKLLALVLPPVESRFDRAAALGFTLLELAKREEHAAELPKSVKPADLPPRSDDERCPECMAVRRTHGSPCIDVAPTMALDHWREKERAAKLIDPKDWRAVVAAYRTLRVLGPWEEWSGGEGIRSYLEGGPNRGVAAAVQKGVGVFYYSVPGVSGSCPTAEAARATCDAILSSTWILDNG